MYTVSRRLVRKTMGKIEKKLPMAIVGTSAMIIRRRAFAIGGSIPITSTTISVSFIERIFYKQR
jgi:hypothetical protein